MARLEDSGNKGLPKSPAPPRRGANPWRLSETARKPEPRPEPIGRQLLEELMQQAPVGEGPAHEGFAHEAPVHAEAPPPAAPSRTRPGLMSLVVVGFAAMIVMRLFFAARKDGDWVGIIGPLLVIAFIAHGWWKFRQRREAKKAKPD